MAGTISVNSTADTVANDAFVTFREALLIARGDRVPYDNPIIGQPDELSQISGSVGAGFADVINVSSTFSPIAITSLLPTLSNSTDEIFAASATIIDASAVSTTIGTPLFDLSTSGHRIRGLTISGYQGTAIRISASGTTLDGTIISGCRSGPGLHLIAGATGATIQNVVVSGTEGDGILLEGASGNTLNQVYSFSNEGSGFVLKGTGTTNNSIYNFSSGVGTPAQGFPNAGNTGWGVVVRDGANGNHFQNPSGAESTSLIAGNSLGGMWITGSGTNNNDMSTIAFGYSVANPAWIGNGVNSGLVVDGGAQGNQLGAEGFTTGMTFGGHSASAIRISGPQTTGNDLRHIYVGRGENPGIRLPNFSHGIEITDGAGAMLIGGDVELSQIEIDFNPGGSGIFLNGTNAADPIDDITIGVFHIGEEGEGPGGLPTIGGDGIRIEGNVDGVVVGGGASFNHPNHLCGAAGYGLRISGGQVNDVELVQIHAGTANTPVPNFMGGVYIGNGARNVRFNQNVFSYIGGNLGPGIFVDASLTPPRDIGITRCYIGRGQFSSTGFSNSGAGVFVKGGDTSTTALTGVSIGGTQAFEFNNIIGNTGPGIQLQRVSGAKVVNNSVGYLEGTTTAAPNGVAGIEIEACDNLQIGGPTNPERNFIAGNSQAGIRIRNSHTLSIHNNQIGILGDSIIANQGPGIQIASPGPPSGMFLTIGGTGSNEGNTISGNLDAGIEVDTQGAAAPVERIRIEGNRIGTDSTGVLARANKYGIFLRGDLLDDVLVGHATSTAGSNTISGNTEAGIHIEGADGWRVVGNKIGTDINGLSAVPNGYGVDLQFTQRGELGPPNAAQRRNTISGNSIAGIRIGDGVYGAVKIWRNDIGISTELAVGNLDGILVHRRNAVEGPLTIGGATSTLFDSTISIEEGNVISGNTRDGIRVFPESDGLGIDKLSIWGNFIGTDTPGVNPIPNIGAGIRIAGSATTDIEIGSSANPALGNLISGNGGSGIVVEGNAIKTQIHQNRIGMGASETANVANSQHGISLADGANQTRIEKNKIFFNKENGVRMDGATTMRNTLSKNSIHLNLKDGIEISSGANAGIAAPVIDRRYIEGRNARQYMGAIDLAGGKVEVFVDPPVTDQPGYWGQGKTFASTRTADGNGIFTIPFRELPSPGIVTATYTDADGNTSEFSNMASVMVVQSVFSQDFLLVAGKPTTVRVYLDTGKGLNTLDLSGRAELGSLTGSPLPAVHTARPYAYFDTREADRKQSLDTMNILIEKPGAGRPELQLVLTDPDGSDERARINYGEYRFENTMAIPMGIVIVEAPDSSGTLRVPDLPAIIEGLRYFGTVYPVSPTDFFNQLRVLPVQTRDNPPHTSDEQYAISVQAEALRLKAEEESGVVLRYAASYVSHLTSFDPPGSGSRLFGYTYTEATPKVVNLLDRYKGGANPPPNRSTLCHEVGHSPPFRFGDSYAGGRLSANNPLPTDPTKFDSTGVLVTEDFAAYSHTGTLRLAGFTSPGPVWSPPSGLAQSSDLHDIMANGPIGWTSEPMLQRMYLLLRTPLGARREGMVDGLLAVRGNVPASGPVTLLPIVRRPGLADRDTIPVTTSPVWRADLVDASEAVLDSQEFSLKQSIEFLGESDTPDPFTHYSTPTNTPFSVLLQDNPAATRVRVYRDGIQVATIATSANAPAVTLLAPTGGGPLPAEVVVAWTASDTDSGTPPLSCDVFYTPDGTTLIPVAADLDGRSSVTLKTSLLPGGPDMRFLVRASDGWLTGEDAMDAPFLPTDRTLQASISQPADGSSVTVGLPFGVFGSAFDPEDGVLQETSLEWRIDGAVEAAATGIEPQLVIDTPGPHTIHLRTVDSFGHVVSDSITVNATSKPYDPLLILQAIGGVNPATPNEDRNGDGTIDLADWVTEEAP
ncbi:MAG: right-handed parallel beta-helix repeat-containing protein [Candidatus Sumerlaeia bacterium]|nr:right-handed parallel beta-helix repeat-containing protein [Candidatus Sumerlaeia bacterium]